MRILGISGSPRKDGNTDTIIKEALNAANEEGAEIELIRLSDYNLSPCTACGVCHKTKDCSIKDDYEKLYQLIAKSDGIIIGSPSYFQGVTAQMKTFIDRIGFVCLARGRRDFEGKAGAAIAVARRSGLSTCNQMTMFLTAVRMIIPSGGRVYAVARDKGDVINDKEGVDTARYMGKMMAKTILKTKEK
jgi:multimeric flavodoxin WrbA